jgi:membrane-associated phospholipid phosphatase
MSKFRLIEPERGYTILQKTVVFSEDYPRIAQFAPTGADIFVFVYPIFLVLLYLKGIIKKQTQPKEGAVFIFLSCFISVLVNIGIQYFFLKNRPNIELIELLDVDIGETLLHGILPNSSFPSDHAVVGMSIAIATLIR